MNTSGVATVVIRVLASVLATAIVLITDLECSRYTPGIGRNGLHDLRPYHRHHNTPYSTLSASRALGVGAFLLLPCGANTHLYEIPRSHQSSLLRVRQHAPVGPIHCAQRQLIREDHEGGAVATNARLTGLGLSRSVDRPRERMQTLWALPQWIWDRHRRASASLFKRWPSPFQQPHAGGLKSPKLLPQESAQEHLPTDDRARLGY